MLGAILDNWDVSASRIAEDRYRLTLRMRRIHSGGVGESRATFNRRAAQLARARGYAGFEVLSYQEGIESTPLLAQRVAEGTIQLVGAPR